MENETNKGAKKGWGGHREGSGRKHDGHGKYYGFNSRPEVERIIEALPGGKTSFINEAILFYAKSKGII